MLKKLALFFSFCALAMVFYSTSKDPVPFTKEKSIAKGWKKYKVSGSKITSSPVITGDLIKDKLIQSRAPASKPQRSLPMRNGRFLDGEGARDYNDMNLPLTYKNKVSPDWKKKLGHSLTRFQKEGTEVLIQKERPVLFIKQGVAEFREQVSINFKLPDGSKSSYRAMVDSSNGKILFTYDRTKMEYFRNKPTGMTHPLAN